MKTELEDLYETEKPRILGWLKGRVGIEQAEDVLHEVMLKTLINADSLLGVRDLQAWIWRSLRNAVIDRWRSRRRGREETVGTDLERWIDESWRSAQDELEKRELAQALARAIAKLPPDQREIISAQLLNGETFASISKRTGVDISTLSARKRRALARLSVELEDFQ